MTTTNAPPQIGGGSSGLLRSSARRPFPTLILVIAVVLSVITGFAAQAIVKQQDPTYRSVGAISFDQPLKVAQSGDAGVIDKLSRIRSTYAGVARTDVVLTAVAEETSLPLGQVAARTFIFADRTSLLMIVGAEYGDAPTARQLAVAFANQIVTTTQEQQDDANVPEKERIEASVVIQPRPASKVAPGSRRSVTAGVVAGLLVFLAVLGISSLVRRKT